MEKVERLGMVLFLLLVIQGCAGSEIKLSPSEWYFLGVEDMKRGNYRGAADAFKMVLEGLPDHRFKVNAILYLADAHFKRKEYEEAKFRYRRFLELYPAHEKADYAYYYLALSSFEQMASYDRDQTPTREALQGFRQLAQRYSQSLYLDDALKKIGQCREQLVRHELSVAEFYFKRREYQSAINRFKEILDQYGDTQFADKALFYLGESYMREESFEKAAEILRNLLATYPQSRYISEAKTILKRLGQTETALSNNR
ncbi:MAG: outer membrane protein assembly factor BamD [Candidatus Tectomicrobia bacterium]|nr:outer membrane protein assembly factor BamD [Candidatus Tectomicrobia bacterium]